MPTSLGRILVVDDEADMTAFLKSVLVLRGYEVVVSLSSEEALETLHEQSFDVLLCDLLMPGRNGIDLLRIGLGIDPQLVGIVITGHGSIASAVEAMQAGAFDYLLKPFDADGLLSVIARAVQFRQLRLENVQLRETVAIYELIKAIASVSDLPTLLNKAADAALQQCSADEVSIMLPTLECRELYVAAARGLDGAQRSHIIGERTPLNQGIAGWVAQHRETVTLHGEVKDSRFSPVRLRSGIYSSVVMPMLSAGKLVGILSVNATHSRLFTPGQVKALDLLAGTVAPVLENARLYKQLEVAEGKYRSIVENAVDGIFQSTPDGIDADGSPQNGRFLTVNSALANLCGYESPAAMIAGVTSIGRQIYLDSADLMALQQRLERESEVRGYETQWRRRDGGTFWISQSTRVVRDENGTVLYYEGIIEDITEQKQSEAELRASEARFRSMVNSELIGIFFWDLAGNMTGANDAFLRMIGHTRGELLSGEITWKNLTPPEYEEIDRQGKQEIIETGACKPYEKEFIRKDGKRLPILIGAATFENSADAGMAFVLDITKRKEAERGLHHALEELRGAHNELEGRVQRRTAELAKANAELQIAKEESERANLAKSEFLSRMSHELRTPLNAILGFGQILTMQDLEPLEQESAEHILKAGDHLLKLINEVLDIARVEAGRMDLSLEPVEIKAVVCESLDLVRPLAEQSKITLEVDESGVLSNQKSLSSSSYVQADRQRLKQALINLLSNAIKYNRPNGKVMITCKPVPQGRMQIEVRDTGLEIQSENLDKIFVPFERLEAGKTAVEGTGLGLTLSQRMVDAMGGTLGVESVQGQGSTFHIELPQAECPLEELATQELSVRNESESPNIEFTVLSIEDNASNHRLIETILRYRPGALLLGAMQGEIGLELAHKHHPDVILLDLHLPDILGHEVLRRLRESPETSDIPVIIVSADATPNQIERLLAAGANAYLTKPLKVKELLSLIDKIVKGDS